MGTTNDHANGGTFAMVVMGMLNANTVSVMCALWFAILWTVYMHYDYNEWYDFVPCWKLVITENNTSPVARGTVTKFVVFSVPFTLCDCALGYTGEPTTNGE